jgi:hypothetical protein
MMGDFDGSDAELRAAVAAIAEELAELRSVIYCPRCAEPAPPKPRWPGDQHSRDLRGPHSCGRTEWSP